MVRRIIDADLKVACPLCKAPPATYCISQGQRMTGASHRERRRAAEEMLASVLRQAEAAVREANRGV